MASSPYPTPWPSVPPNLEADVNALVRYVQNGQLLIRHLQMILTNNSLKVSGVKSELQRRVVDLIYQVASTDSKRFAEVRRDIQTAKDPSPSQAPGFFSGPGLDLTVPKMATNTTQNGYGSGHSNEVYFKPSPFYDFVARLGDLRVLEAMANHKNTVEISIRAHDSLSLSACVNDPAYRVFVFCANDRHGVQDVAFPQQSELRVNDDEVKANLRGLKNKPGSTRPVDITSFLRLKVPAYTNKLTFRYALTSKEFYLQLNVCKIKPVAELVAKVQAGRKIPIASVKAEISAKAKDSEVVTTSQVLSLKCPLSYVRMHLPCRSTACKHVQCFDATSYLQLQEQGPQWLCPICNKQAKFDDLAVDEYVKDILAHTPDAIDQVTIEPDGTWLTQGVTVARQRVDAASDVLDIEDLVPTRDASEDVFSTPARSAPNFSLPVPTPPSKRKIDEVIDLTLDSDEDDEPIARPAKRQHLTNLGVPSLI